MEAGSLVPLRGFGTASDDAIDHVQRIMDCLPVDKEAATPISAALRSELVGALTIVTTYRLQLSAHPDHRWVFDLVLGTERWLLQCLQGGFVDTARTLGLQPLWDFLELPMSSWYAHEVKEPMLYDISRFAGRVSAAIQWAIAIDNVMPEAAAPWLATMATRVQHAQQRLS
jgi:hypothetical protein